MAIMEQSAHPYGWAVRLRDGERTHVNGEIGLMALTTRRNASAMKTVGALLALYRQAAGRAQRSLGERFAISEQQITSIEQGRRRSADSGPHRTPGNPAGQRSAPGQSRNVGSSPIARTRGASHERHDRQFTALTRTRRRDNYLT
ncbi:hypothetical protein AB0D65_19635 [Streptomyces griseoloalbus]|uniref:Helix-turn-helix domain-containing protein n=1 Tax=Streptomyces griseoloalbus TaxID=67303 RepID=A0ABV3E7M6_9ACTN